MSLPRTTPATLAAITAAACIAAPTTAAAQGGGRALTVTAVQGITFGNVIPGVPSTIAYTDFARAGQFVVRGPTGAQVEITFTLPSSLAGPGSNLMPMGWAANSCGVSPNGTQSTATPADPRGPFTTTIDPRNGRVYLYLGGIAQPLGTNAAGTYTGTVVLTAALTGL